jgi:hypothetical protein
MDEKLKDQDVLLVREKGSSELNVAKMDKAGKVKQTSPDDRHKTQVAVNSEGKTTEATKNVKEPLNKGQIQPTEKQAEKQEKQKKPKKSKGMKM